MEISEEKIPNKKHSALKVFLIIFIILILLAVGLCTGGYFYINNQKNEIQQMNTNAIKEMNETIEYGESISYETILEKLVASDELSENSKIQVEVNNQVLNPSEEYTFQTTGNITIKITITCDNVSFLKQSVTSQKEITWEIADTKKPVLSGVQNSEITVGDTFDVKSGITATDEVDGDLEVTVEGEFDATKAGTYTLTAKAVDKNGNETTQEFTVTVKEKPVTPSPKPSTGTSSNKKPTDSSGNTSSGNTSSSSTSSGNSSSGNSNVAPDGTTYESRLAMAKAEAKRVVSQIITPGMTDLQKAEAIVDYLGNVSWQLDQGTEEYKINHGNEAYAALVMKISACSGFCRAVTLLCNEAGLQSQHINANKWEHQWNLVLIDGVWYHLDAMGGWLYPEE